MLIEYETRLKKPAVADENGHRKVITQIWFTVYGIDAETGAEAENSCSLTPPMPEPGADFTPFEAVTQDMVKAWVEASPAYEEARGIVANAIRGIIAEQAAKAKGEPVETAFPWESRA